MEKPILLGLEGESRELIEAYEAGVCYSPENYKSFNEALHHLKTPRVYAKAKIGAREFARNFNRTDIARSMFRYFQSI